MTTLKDQLERAAREVIELSGGRLSQETISQGAERIIRAVWPEGSIYGIGEPNMDADFLLPCFMTTPDVTYINVLEPQGYLLNSITHAKRIES